MYFHTSEKKEKKSVICFSDPIQCLYKVNYKKHFVLLATEQISNLILCIHLKVIYDNIVSPVISHAELLVHILFPSWSIKD